MKWILLIFSMFTAIPPAEPVLQAKISSISIKECGRTENTYDINIQGIFEIENISQDTILVGKKIDMIRTITASSSSQEAKNKAYSFIMNQEFGVNLNTLPKIKDFTVIKPGHKALVHFGGITIPVSAESSRAGTERLRPGSQWFQFEFSAIPSSYVWDRKESTQWKAKWKNIGVVADGYFTTSPFEINTLPNTNLRKCDLDSK